MRQREFDDLHRYLSANDRDHRAVDVLVVLGSSDVRVADRAALVWRDLRPAVTICSGARGRLTQGWPMTEAAAFAGRLAAAGVPRSRILLEERSTNTFENAGEVAGLLTARRPPRRLAIVTRPHLRLRASLTFARRFPDTVVVVDPDPTAGSPEMGRPRESEVREQVVDEVIRIDRYAAIGDIKTPSVPGPLRQSWASVLNAPATSSRSLRTSQAPPGLGS